MSTRFDNDGDPQDWPCRAEADVPSDDEFTVVVPAPRRPADLVPSPVVVPVAEQVEGTHFEVDLDPEPQTGGAPVDLPPGSPTLLAIVDGEKRRPVIPAGLRGRQNLRATLADVVDRALHVAAFHAVRAPWYTLETCWWASVGVVQVAGRALGWWWVVEQVRLRQKVADGDDPIVWLRLHQEVRRT